MEVHTARFHVALQHRDLALALVTRLLAAPTRPVEAYEVAAALACSEDRTEDCLAHARTAIELGTSSAMTYFLAASALLSAGAEADLADAQRLLEGSLAREPGFAPAQWTLARVYAAAGRSPTDTLQLAERAIELAPRESEPYLAAAAALMSAGKSADAIRRAEQGVRYAQTEEARARARAFVDELRRTTGASPALTGPQTSPLRPSQDGGAPGRTATEVRWEIRYDSQGIDLDAWLKGFSDQLEAALQRAASVFARTGHVTLSLSIRKDGSLEHVTVARPSGVTVLDDEVRATVAAVTGVPLPEAYPAATMNAEVTLSVNEPAPAEPKP
jgi:TonB family protein